MVEPLLNGQNIISICLKMTIYLEEIIYNIL